MKSHKGKLIKTDDKLTSTEMGKLWATYTGNSMAVCILRYFLNHSDDAEIKRIVKNALNLSRKIVADIKQIFIRDHFPVPIGYTEEDVNLDAPRLFSDEFYLHYLNYTSKAGMNIYSTSVSLVTRKDVRDFFVHTLHSTVKLVTDVNDVLKSKGLMIKPASIPTPEKVDFVKQQSFLNGFFGNIRPIHAVELAHMYDIIEKDITSKALLIGFSQVAKTDKVKKLFLRGKEITNKHIKSCEQMLNKDDLPSPPLLDDLVGTSTVSPFSDKLMLWHKIDMFSVKITSYANGIAFNGRRDIGGMYAKFIMDVGLYVEDGANIMIDHGWMEQPPLAADREGLARK